MSLKEVMDSADLTRSRAMRLTGTLEHRGYLNHDPETRRYRLGYRLLALGKSLESNSSLVLATRPILKELAEKTGESAALFVLDGMDRVVLAREESPWSIRFSVSEGQRIPLPAGAGGKVLIAFGPKKLRKKVLHPKTLERLTRNTQLDPIGLAAELGRIASQGFAASIAERAPDSWAAAAPVFDGKNDLVGTLTIAGPINRLTPEERERSTRILVAQARKLSRLLGWVGERSDNGLAE